jgi:predicted protein tyrosine phosphatase
MRALFVCSQNRLRSPTAEAVFATWLGVECESAGVHDSADVPVGPELLAWAEVIFVMEKAHHNKLSKRWRKHMGGKRVVCLNIPDDFEYMDETLVRLLEAKVSPHLLARGCRPPQPQQSACMLNRPGF